MRIIDRYVIRQVLVPFGIGLIVFTFIFIIDALREYVEPLVAKGIPADVLVRVLGTLIPQALALSIPMSLLLGLLVAFGRLSGDREFVAMQACGVSLKRLLWPVATVSIVAWAATSYVMLVAVPASNQTFREITFNIIADRAEGEVRPRVFFDDFANLVLYVREVPRDGAGWNGVFIADSRTGPAAEIFLARRGHVRIDRVARTVAVVLTDGSRHTPEGGEYQIFKFDDFTIRIDPESVFPSGGWPKGDNEMTIAELRGVIAQHLETGVSTHNQVMAIHRKFAIPVACLVFGVIGLALGATNRRDGAMGSFGLGLVVVFAYYIPMFFFPQLAKGGFIAPWLAVWMPNIIVGAFAIVLFVWRNKVADQPIRISIPLPGMLRRFSSAVTVSRPMARTSLLSILDTYVSGAYLRILILSAGASLAVFYISTFIDLSGHMFKGNAPWYTVFEYLWYATPQIGYYVLPISVLIATLVTVGVLTRNSELVVMKACGVSLYRVALPMLVCAGIVGGSLFLLDATILGPSNRHAEELRDQIKGATRLRPLERPWYVGADGTIYHFRSYDPRGGRFDDVEVFEFAGNMERLFRRTLARRAIHDQEQRATSDGWRLEDGWTRTFDRDGDVPKLATFDRAVRKLEPAEYFAQEPPDARFMGRAELSAHADRLRTSGLDVVEHDVDVARKVAYPFVTLIMTIIAIPFAVTMGRSGTMAGIAAGIGFALLYWGTISFAAALGTGGVLAPAMSAWAPNVLFGAGAAYLLLTART